MFLGKGKFGYDLLRHSAFYIQGRSQGMSPGDQSPPNRNVVSSFKAEF